MNIALATCRHLPEPDPDEGPLLRALREAGHEARTLAWDDPASDPTPFELVILRATWNYHERPDDFLAWIDGVARVARVVNPPAVVRWNIHKRYLAELGSRGVPTVPTVFISRGQSCDVGRQLRRGGWERVVIKPAVSAASFRTRLFGTDERDAAQAHLDDLLREGDAMIQRYLPRVETDRERAIVWIDGQVTHVVRKSVRLQGQDESVSAAGLDPSPDERTMARRVIDALQPQIRQALLYARIDVMPDDDGSWVLSELELMEPSLFFPQSARALRRFVDAVDRLAP